MSLIADARPPHRAGTRPPSSHRLARHPLLPPHLHRLATRGPGDTLTQPWAARIERTGYQLPNRVPNQGSRWGAARRYRASAPRSSSSTSDSDLGIQQGRLKRYRAGAWGRRPGRKLWHRRATRWFARGGSCSAWPPHRREPLLLRGPCPSSSRWSRARSSTT
jgi:hypothetical protein